MSRLTDFLKLHIWEIPKDNNEKFNYTKAIADNFDKIDAGLQNAVSKFTEPLSYKGSVLNYKNLPIINTNGDIYTVTSENKNYIWNGTTWEEYASNIDLTPIEEKIITEKTTQVAEELSIPNTAPVNGKLDIKSGKSEQETSTASRNICPTDFEEWESGQYSDTNGEKKDYEGRIRLNRLLKVSPTTTYYFYCSNSTYKFIFRMYDSTGTFVRSIGSLENFTTLTTEDDEYYLGISMWKQDDGYITYEEYQTAFEDGTITPFICLNSETDKTYTEFIPNMPSPDYPSYIRNVGDNINILNNTLTSETRNGITITVNKDKSITINGTATALTVFPLGEVNLVKNNTYTLSGADNGSTSSYRLDMRLSAGGNIYNGWLHAPKDSDNKPTYTMTENITLYPHLRIQSGATINNVIIYPKVEESPIATGYSEYGCGSVGVKVENKNIAYVEVYDKMRNYGNGNFSSNNAYNCYIARVKPNTEYTVSFLGADNNVSNLCYFDKDMKYIKGDPFNVKNPRKFITPDNCEYITIAVMKTTSNFMIEEGNVATDYVEHKEQTVTFPMTKGQLIHKGDYLAEDGIHQVKGTLVLTGEETTWVKGGNDTWSNNAYVFGLTIDDAQKISTNMKYPEVVSSHYKNASDINQVVYGPTNNNYIANMNVAYKNLWILDKRFDALEDFKTYLAEQYAKGTPVTVEYALATETITPYTEEQKEAYYQLQHLLMYEGYTSIECIDEIKPDIQLTYLYNNELNKTYGKKIDTLEARIRQLEQMITSQSEVVE